MVYIPPVIFGGGGSCSSLEAVDPPMLPSIVL